MIVLLTNDDGIHAPGLKALYRALGQDHQVYVVAPEMEQSAVGHSITLADPIRVKEIRFEDSFAGYALSGTPADCVRIGVSELIRPRPEAVVSGINVGANVGLNVLYSGTVSAATEAAILGLPALAVSLDTFTEPDFTYAADFTRRLVADLPHLDLAPGASLNVNLPALPPDQIKGVIWTRQCLSPAGEEFSRRQDPRGKAYYWRGREIPPDRPDPDSDFSLLGQGYITITPLQHDLTNYIELTRLSPHKITH
ncbi:MAG: 5'/3'-nucleotidase SurE [Thermodesulfobacteriota bacterium]